MAALRNAPMTRSVVFGRLPRRTENVVRAVLWGDDEAIAGAASTPVAATIAIPTTAIRTGRCFKANPPRLVTRLHAEADEQGAGLLPTASAGLGHPQVEFRSWTPLILDATGSQVKVLGTPAAADAAILWASAAILILGDGPIHRAPPTPQEVRRVGIRFSPVLLATGAADSLPQWLTGSWESTSARRASVPPSLMTPVRV
jgi:hypothetical protein